MKKSARYGVGLLGLALSSSVLAVAGSAPAVAAEPVTISLLNINDFHGRIDKNTTKFATTVEQLRASAGEANTLFLSAGDNIGASLFASSNQRDQPTIDVLNALGLQGSAVGNHEFDRGMDDLAGRVSTEADWDYLGANVYQRGTTTPALDEYATYEVAGVTVGVIGTVTEETPSLVTPSGVADLEFGDPVEATNRVAAQLSDGDTTNGEADVIVAEYHEGAGAGVPDGSTLEEEVAAGGTFADIVNNTSPAVDAIFTGHTHKQYAWDAPIPGTDDTRPILQTGSYGENVGQIELTVDPASGDVSAYTAHNVARAATEDLGFARVAAVKTIVDAALADAAVVGNQKITDITADITTAYAGGSYGADGYQGPGPEPKDGRDDRSRESALGDLVANALRDGISDIATVDLGITNPGGLRDELFYAGDTSTNPVNTDGVVTFAEANAVLPFNNTVAVVSLTGAQLKGVLEQQWQRDAKTGEIPSRPYLQLGLSDNVQVTADPTLAEGSRITSVTIDGAPLDPARTYKVSTLSFLATGGDNFTTFADGSYVDTGLLDAELWRDYLAANAPISPDFARQQVFTAGLSGTFAPGSDVDGQLGVGETTAPVVPINAKTLDLTSLGAPVNTDAEVTLTKGTQTVPLGTVAITDGILPVQFTAPTETGTWTLTAVAQPSGTEVSVPVTVAKAASTVKATLEPRRVVAKKTKAKVIVTVKAGDQAAQGKVTVKVGGRTYQASLSDGRAVVKLKKFKRPGTYRAAVTYLGNDATKASSTTVTIEVVKKK